MNAKRIKIVLLITLLGATLIFYGCDKKNAVTLSLQEDTTEEPIDIETIQPADLNEEENRFEEPLLEVTDTIIV